MAGPIKIAILANGRQARAELRGTATAATSFGSTMHKAGRLAAVGIAAATAATVALGKRTVTAASASQQSIGATETVYSRYADSVIRKSNKAAAALGLSANEYRELANVSGAMLKSSEIPLRRVTDLTAQLNRRAADVAATFGGSTREAVEAFNAMLRGETDPVERYGVAIKQTDVNARLAAKGQAKLTGSSLKQASALARLDLLFKQTRSSQGQFRRESDTFAGQQQRLSAEIENTEAAVGKVLLPTLTDLALWTRREVVPQLRDAAKWFEQNEDKVSGAAKAIGGELLGGLKDITPALKTTANLAAAAAKAYASLPDPVKKLGVEAAVLAVVLPRVATGLASVTTTAATATTAMARFSVGTATATQRARMANAALMGAGLVGGLALMADQSDKTGKAVGVLGGALTGAFVGGTIGSAIPGVGTAIGAAGGAAAGAAVSTVRLMKASDDAAMALVRATDAARRAATAAGDYRGSLDQVTGAATRATRAVILQNAETSGARDLVARLGVNTRDLIGAVLGNEGATRRMARAWRDNASALDGNEQVELRTWLDRNTTAMARQAAQVRQNRADLQTWNKALKGLPPEVRTRVKAIGTDITGQQLDRLRKKYDLSRRQVNTVVRAVGTEAALRKINGVWVAIRNGRKITADLDPFVASLVDAMNRGKRSANTGTTGILRELERGPRRAKADLTGYNASVRDGTATAERWATSGGTQVGANLKSGVISGFAGTLTELSNMAAAAVRAAVAAAKNAGEIRSPSRVMRDKVGKPLAQGITVGFARGVRDGTPKINTALDKLLKSVEQKLEKAQEKYKALRQTADAYASSIRAGFQTYGSVVGLGTTGGGSAVTLPALLSQLAARATIAEQFASVVASLRNKLNKTSLRQLLDQASSGDLEGALATAQAIASGGATAAAQINALTAQITQAGGQLGQRMRNTFYGHGLKVAEGVVKGLERRQKRLDRIADRAADRLGSRQSGGSTKRPTAADTYTRRTPALDTYMRQSSTPAAAPVHLELHVHAPVGASSQEIGRTLTKHIDAYFTAGGRHRARWA